MILNKRKIELRERYLSDKEMQMAEWEERLGQTEQQLLRDREEVMAKLEESVLSHVSIPQSEGPVEEHNEEQEPHEAANGQAADKKEVLMAGIEAREQLLANQQAQLQSQNALLQKSLGEKLEQIRKEEVQIAGKFNDLRDSEKKLHQRKSQVE